MKNRRGQPELLKEINRTRAYDALKRAGTLSRAQLAKTIGLSPASVSTLAEDLLQAGIVEEVGLGRSTGGRPPMMLRFNPNAAYVLGARLSDQEWGIIAINLNGEIIHRHSSRLQGPSPEEGVAALVQGVKGLMAHLNTSKVLPAIGLGTPGLVDIYSGVIKTAVDVGWFDVPIKRMVEDALGMPVYVANRSKVGALAELLYGAGKSVEDLIYISIGTGVVAGLIHKGELFIGANSSAGELGHVTVIPDGPLCPCGNRGCLQQLAAGPAIAARARARMRMEPAGFLQQLVGNHPELITAETVFQAAEQGDPVAKAVVDETAKYLGIALANLVNLFNPELIIIGGSTGRAGEILLKPLWHEIQSRAMAYPLSAATLVVSTLGQDTGAIGAAAMVLQRATQILFNGSK